MLTKAILTDIEGTTTALSFVHDVLFPYARAALPEFIRHHQQDPEVKALLDALRDQQQRYLTEQQIIDLLLAWMNEDRKDTILKALQGRIWEAGYQTGDFTGHVYADAAEQLKAWHARGLALYVFSSGSVAAQKLLFGYSDFGDLRPLFAGYFDTRIGVKREAGAYKKIAAEITLPPEQVLFLSDIVEELNAARAAGMQTVQLIRENQAPGDHKVAYSFAEITPE